MMNIKILPSSDFISDTFKYWFEVSTIWDFVDYKFIGEEIQHSKLSISIAKKYEIYTIEFDTPIYEYDYSVDTGRTLNDNLRTFFRRKVYNILSEFNVEIIKRNEREFYN